MQNNDVSYVQGIALLL